MANIGAPSGTNNTPYEAEKPKRALLIMGPTASGKTALACALYDAWAQSQPCRLISVDSAQVYRGMDIGTAKPSKEELLRWPHALIDIRDPWQAYSAADFRQDALQEMESAHETGELPVLVGGTMLYFQALRQGLARMPPADALLREQLQQELEQLGKEALHARLQQVDPQAARRIHPNDPQRLLRALEVYALTGKPISHWQTQQHTQPPDWTFLSVVVSPSERRWLHTRIAQRIDHMLQQGLIEEVERLQADARMSLDLPSMRSVGYRQVWRYLQGELDREEMANRLLYATRQLAKRQFTWLRKEQPHWQFDPMQKDWIQLASRQLAAALR